MNALASELLKLRTTRSTFALGLGMLAIAALVVVGTVGSGVVGDADRPALELVSAVSTGVGIFATVLGILVVTSEYRHGTITPTFLVSPRRERVIAAKVAAGAVTGLVIAAILIVLMLAIAVPWLASRDEALPFDGELALAIVRLIATFVLSVVLGVAIGTALHSQIAAIVTVFAWFLILEPLLGVVVDYVLDVDLAPYLPGSVFGVLSGVEDENSVDPFLALALLIGYTAAITGIGVILTMRRDAD